MKFIVCRSDNLKPLCIYDSAAMDLSRYETTIEVIHAEVQTGADPAYCTISFDGAKWIASPKIDLTYIMSVIAKRSDFGKVIIAQFAGENNIMRITPAQSSEVITKLQLALLELQLGAIETAIYQIKQLTDEQMDGIFLTKPRLLKYVNMCEDFLGIAHSEAW